jgi:hypothetical protein
VLPGDGASSVSEPFYLKSKIFESKQDLKAASQQRAPISKIASMDRITLNGGLPSSHALRKFKPNQAAFERDTARAARPTPPDLLAQLNAARREKGR